MIVGTLYSIYILQYTCKDGLISMIYSVFFFMGTKVFVHLIHLKLPQISSNINKIPQKLFSN